MITLIQRKMLQQQLHQQFHGQDLLQNIQQPFCGQFSYVQHQKCGYVGYTTISRILVFSQYIQQTISTTETSESGFVCVMRIALVET